MNGDEGGLHCEGSGVCISKKMLSPSGDAVRNARWSTRLMYLEGATSMWSGVVLGWMQEGEGEIYVAR
jgi:hypothetical protein